MQTPKKRTMSKERADKLLLRRGLAESREKAQAMIMAGLVFSEGERIEKSGWMIEETADLSVIGPLRYVSRGGLKLEQALDAFGVDPSGRITADIGSSTGGFTDCLLQRGAKKVYVVDVDIRQLDWRLAQDLRVIKVEKNARYLEPGDFAEKPDIITMDVSFISILKILPALRIIQSREGILLALIKPQFEAGRLQVGKRGVVRSSAVHEDVLEHVLRAAQEKGFHLRGLIRCETRGRKGNVEFFACFSGVETSRSPEDLQALIKEVIGDEEN